MDIPAHSNIKLVKVSIEFMVENATNDQIREIVDHMTVQTETLEDEYGCKVLKQDMYNEIKVVNSITDEGEL